MRLKNILVGISLVLLLTALPSYSAQEWVGRTTLMGSDTIKLKNVPKDSEVNSKFEMERRMNSLVELVTSHVVLERVAETLKDINLSRSPEELLRDVSIKPVNNTNILCIETIAYDPEEAKIIVDVVAAEVKKAYSESFVAEAKNNRVALQMTVKETKKAIDDSYKALKSYKAKTNDVSSAERAILESDAKAAVYAYESAKKKLADAKLSESQIKRQNVLKTIDPTYFYPKPLSGADKLANDIDKVKFVIVSLIGLLFQ